jgi:hypothetical protein
LSGVYNAVKKTLGALVIFGILDEWYNLTGCNFTVAEKNCGELFIFNLSILYQNQILSWCLIRCIVDKTVE